MGHKGRKKQAQFSVIEMILVFSLFAFAMTFLYEAKEPVDTNYEYSVESFLNSLYYNETIIHTTLQEDLSSSSITQNWSSTQAALDLAFNSYGLSISNTTVSKTIFSCNATYNKYITQRPVTISNLTLYDFRTITLMVCY